MHLEFSCVFVPMYNTVTSEINAKPTKVRKAGVVAALGDCGYTSHAGFMAL